jgi:hypothetical protein
MPSIDTLIISKNVLDESFFLTAIKSGFATTLIWFILILIILWYFGKDIKSKLRGILEAKFSDYGLKFASNESRPVPNTNETAHEYWLAHDIYWTIMVLISTNDINPIIHGLKQSAFHAESLNLIDRAGIFKNLIQNIENGRMSIFSNDKNQIIGILQQQLLEIGAVLNDRARRPIE